MNSDIKKRLNLTLLQSTRTDSPYTSIRRVDTITNCSRDYWNDEECMRQILKKKCDYETCVCKCVSNTLIDTINLSHEYNISAGTVHINGGNTLYGVGIQTQEFKGWGGGGFIKH